MATPSPRQRNAAFPLILLGIVLALATAVLVLFLTNGGGGATLQGGNAIVVASRTLTTGTILSANNDTPPYASVASAFHVEHISASAVPADALAFTGESDLASILNGKIITQSFFAGDILRKSDQRMAELGNGPTHSLVNHNPSALPDGSVLFPLQANGLIAQEGDHVDVLATLCVSAAKSASCQMTQTTLQNLLIYSVVNQSTLVVVVSHQDALALKLLVETAKIDLVLRKPGDTSVANTHAIDPNWIISHFGFTPPAGG
jgi:Flp pilus assembly protein CpaB